MSALPVAAEFEAALPEGWECEVLQNRHRQWEVWAYHGFYPNVQIGPKLKLVPADVAFLRSRVDDVIAPPMTYSQWLAAGERHGFAVAAKDTPLTRGLRLLAICIERGDVDAGDVAQALFKADTYTVQCPVAAALNGDANVAELDALLADAAKQHGYPFDWEALTEDKE
jgi:hypothetical protein